MAAQVAWVEPAVRLAPGAQELLGPTVQHRGRPAVRAATVDPAVMAARVEKVALEAWHQVTARPGRMAMAAKVVPVVLQARPAMAETALPEMPPRPMVVPGVPGVRQARQAWVAMGVQPVAQVPARALQAPAAHQCRHRVETAATAERALMQQRWVLSVATAVQVAPAAVPLRARQATAATAALGERARAAHPELPVPLMAVLDRLAAPAAKVVWVARRPPVQPVTAVTAAMQVSAATAARGQRARASQHR